MEIQEAIEVVRSHSFSDLHWRLSAAYAVLIRVAEAWVTLRNSLATCDHGHIVCAEHMDKLLNPAPKSDIERVREWLIGLECFTDPALRGQPRIEMVRTDVLLKFLDQLEKERIGEKP